jgi:hypothetical protein
MNPVSGIIKDIDGNFSSKRVGALTALAGLLGCLAAHVVGHTPPDYIVHAFTFVASSGMGLSCAERFAPKAQ